MNQRYEVMAFHPFFGSKEADLKVMTWNVHCAKGTDSTKQKQIAGVILDADADIVLLNEFNLDSCCVIDSLLRMKYAFTEEGASRQKCGDMFYSKMKLENSEHPKLSRLWRNHFGKSQEEYPDSLRGTQIEAIRATLTIGADSVMIIGCHWASSSGDGSTIVNGVDSLMKVGSFYERYKLKQKLRVKQAEFANWMMDSCMHPIILMGDLNDFNQSPPLRKLKDYGLSDSWWEGGFGLGDTFHTGWMRLRLDHIFHSDGLKLSDIKVIPTELSDHNLLVATFTIRKIRV